MSDWCHTICSLHNKGIKSRLCSNLTKWKRNRNRNRVLPTLFLTMVIVGLEQIILYITNIELHDFMIFNIINNEGFERMFI